MRGDRWRELCKGDGKLTPEEVAEGWHFCPDWDGLLIHPSHPEMDACCCDLLTKVDSQHAEDRP